MGGVVSALVGSILSSLAQNLLLLPHNCRRRIQHQQQQQHNDNSSHKIQIVVVDKKSMEPSQISLLEIAEGDEDTNYTINYGPRNMVPLVCCHGMFLSKFRCPGHLAIWNPTTSNKKDMIKPIPPSTVPRPPRVEYDAVLTYGFGFDPSSNDYKVIKFIHFDFEDCTNGKLVELYSFKTNSWKQIAFPHGDDVHYGSDLVCVNANNGFCYCRANGARLVFISFDLANDNFPPALIPGPPNTCRSSFFPVEFEGSLAVIAYQCEPFECELWVWIHDNESWSLRGSWAIGGIGYSPRGKFVSNGVLFLQNSRDQLVLFDSAKQTLKTVGVYGPFVYVFPCVESQNKDKNLSISSKNN